MIFQYQNNQTGDAFDITNLVTAAKWTTKRRGSPAKMEISVLSSTPVVWVEGGIFTMLDDDNTGLFYGYVFKITRTEDETVSIIAYDQTRYLKNKDTYVFSGVRADQVLSLIAADYKLKVGKLPATGYVIPSMVFDIKPLFDIILEAIDRTLIHAGRMFYLWDDFGALRLSEVIVPKEVPVIGENSLATGFEYSSSIDGDTYNKVKLVRDNDSTGKRDVYIALDGNNMGLWGILQYQEQVDENLNAAQVKERCMKMLELYNRPEQELKLSALSLPGLRAGQIIYAALPKIGVERTFLVEEVTQDILDETMELKVKVV
ncbi:hypothetical protein DSECCO2_363010 [anaerobic digester metagenome]